MAEGALSQGTVLFKVAVGSILEAAPVVNGTWVTSSMGGRGGGSGCSGRCPINEVGWLGGRGRLELV